MTVDVLFFGALRESAGAERQQVELGPGATAGDLLTRLRPAGAGLLWDRLAVAVNREFAGPERVLAEGDEVALLPPVSGGAQ